MSQFFFEIVNNNMLPIIIYEDNKGAICVAHNLVNHKRSKHIDILHHFIRDEIKKEITN